jgi:predicted DNA-binding protein (MmcQ/YjbR family)
VRSGSAEPHHVLPQSGWVSVYLQKPGDVARAIQLLRRSYEIALVAQARKQSA